MWMFQAPSVWSLLSCAASPWTVENHTAAGRTAAPALGDAQVTGHVRGPVG
jgi:hypothetical protein